MKFAERVSQLKPSPTLAITSKAKEMKKAGIDIIGFGAGEPDFDTPENIKNAAVDAIKKGFTKYTPASGTAELKAAISKKFAEENKLSYKPDEIVVSCGAKHSLYNIFQVLCDKGDEVMVILPYWVSYPEMVSLSGAATRIVKAREENGFVIDPADIARAVTKRTKALIVNSPSNPTGAVFEEGILAEIAKIAVKKGIFVISDEIYEDLIYGEKRHASIGALGKDIFKYTITVNGVSKTYSMTGWRIGYAAGPAEVMGKISALQSHSTSNPTSISQMAALEALRGGKGEFKKMKAEFALRRDFMADKINSFGKITCVKPDGAFYIFVNIKNTGLDSVMFSNRLLEEAHVACVPGVAFGSDSHVRLSFATSMANIKTGLARIEEWLEKI